MPKTPENKNRKLFYRRATSEGLKKETLENLLKTAHDVYPSTSQRTYSMGTNGVEFHGANYKYKEKTGFFIHIVTYVPDQPTSILTKPSSQTSTSIEVSPAPTGKDYLEGDIFLLINKNDIVICQSGARENIAILYIKRVLEQNNVKHVPIDLCFERVAKVDKIRMIKSEGIKEISLNSSLYEASLIHMNEKNSRFVDLNRIIADQIKRIFAEDPTYQEIQERENVVINLSIKFDGKEAMRHKKEKDFGEVGKERLEKTSEKLLKEVEDDDDYHGGFSIITNSGNKITPNDIEISDKSRIKTLGKSLQTGDAWDKLEEYFQTLFASGIISQ